MLAAIDRIGRYTAGVTEAQFTEDEKTVEAVCFALVVLGEAATHVPGTVQAKAAVPWRKIKAMRNMAAHEYFGIDAQSVWHTATADVPSLRPALEALLGQG